MAAIIQFFARLVLGHRLNHRLPLCANGRAGHSSILAIRSGG